MVRAKPINTMRTGRLRQAGSLLLCCLSLGGCWNTTPQQQSQREDAAAAAQAEEQARASQSRGLCGEEIAPALGLKLAMAQQQQQQGRLYAALAGLNTLDSDSPTYRLVRADLLRRLGQYEQARGLYQQLQSTCLAGRALYGLGLIAAWQGQVADALRQLDQAVKLAPTQADLRNDYGFLLLMSGQDQAARSQLMTALELDGKHTTAARNLWFLLLKEGDQPAADALARRFNWSAAEQGQMLTAIQHFVPLRVMAAGQS